MTGNSIHAKSEALELHALSSEELDAVSGGNKAKEQENRKQMEAMKAFRKALEGII